MYLGEHHPTDVLGSLIFAARWLTGTTLLINPNAELPSRSPSRSPSAVGAKLRSFTGRAVSRPPDRAPAR